MSKYQAGLSLKLMTQQCYSPRYILQLLHVQPNLLDNITFPFFLFKAKMWVETFLSMSSVVQGYQRRNITPYMHILVYHVPQMIRNNGNIKQFSGQGEPYLNYDSLGFSVYRTFYCFFPTTGVEKNNDDSKRNYFSSNKWDAPKEILISEERISKLRNMARMKRKYTKKDTSYWEGTILELRSAKRPHTCMYDD